MSRSALAGEAYVPDTPPSSTHNEKQNQSSDDLITMLKIRAAVLENDLAHARREKEDAVRSSVIIAKALALSLESSNEHHRGRSSADKESDIGDLRFEISTLKRGLKKLENHISSGDTSFIKYLAEKTSKRRDKEERRYFGDDESFDFSSNGEQIKSPTTPHKRAEVQGIYDARNAESNIYSRFAAYASPDHSTGGANTPIIPSTSRTDTFTSLENLLATSSDEDSPKTPKGPPSSAPTGPKSLIPLPPPTSRAPTYPRHGTLQSYNRFSSPTPSISSPKLTLYHSSSSFYSSQEEKQDAITSHIQFARSSAFASPGNAERKGLPEFFRYGIRFIPEEFGDAGFVGLDGGVKQEVGVYRSVLITGVPSEMALGEVMERVRGGVVVKAVMGDTSPLMGCKSVLITFLKEEGAKTFIELIEGFPEVLTIEQGKKMKVQHLQDSPTYPLDISMQKTVFELGQSRMLSITHHTFASEPREKLVQMLSEMRDDLAFGNGWRGEGLLSVWRYTPTSQAVEKTNTENGNEDISGHNCGDAEERKKIYLSFNSLNAAGSAYGILTSWHKYQYMGLIVTFESDPCASSFSRSPSTPGVSSFTLHQPDIDKFTLHPWSGEILTLSARGSDRGRNSFEGNRGRGDEKNTETEIEGDVMQQRKRLAALQDQLVVIPTFDYKNMEGENSWADEVIDESSPLLPSSSVLHDTALSMELSTSTPLLPSMQIENEHATEKSKNNAIYEENFKAQGFRNPPVGLAGSRFADPPSSSASSTKSSTSPASSSSTTSSTKKSLYSQRSISLPRLASLVEVDEEEGEGGGGGDKYRAGSEGDVEGWGWRTVVKNGDGEEGKGEEKHQRRAVSCSSSSFDSYFPAPATSEYESSVRPEESASRIFHDVGEGKEGRREVDGSLRALE